MCVCMCVSVCEYEYEYECECECVCPPFKLNLMSGTCYGVLHQNSLNRGTRHYRQAHTMSERIIEK